MKDLNSLLEHVHEHLRSSSIFQIYIYVNGHINEYVFVHMCATVRVQCTCLFLC